MYEDINHIVDSTDFSATSDLFILVNSFGNSDLGNENEGSQEVNFANFGDSSDEVDFL